MREKLYKGTKATSKRTDRMLVVHFPVTLFEVVISIVIPISRMVVYTSLTFELYSALHSLVIAYVGFRIKLENKKIRNEYVINDLHERLY